MVGWLKTEMEEWREGWIERARSRQRFLCRLLACLIDGARASAPEG